MKKTYQFNVEVRLTGYWGDLESMIGDINRRIAIVQHGIQNANIPFDTTGVYGSLLSVREAPKEIIQPDFIVREFDSKSSMVSIELSTKLSPYAYDQAWWDDHYLLPVFYTEDNINFIIKHWVTYSKTHSIRPMAIVPFSELLPVQTSNTFFDVISYLRLSPMNEKGMVIECHGESGEIYNITHETVELKDGTKKYRILLDGKVPLDQIDQDIYNATCYLKPVGFSALDEDASIKTTWVEINFSLAERDLETITGTNKVTQWMDHLLKEIKEQRLVGRWSNKSTTSDFKVVDVNPTDLTVRIEWQGAIEVSVVEELEIRPIFFSSTISSPTLIGFTTE